jgi:hypothetical protein
LYFFLRVLAISDACGLRCLPAGRPLSGRGATGSGRSTWPWLLLEAAARRLADCATTGLFGEANLPSGSAPLLHAGTAVLVYAIKPAL